MKPQYKWLVAKLQYPMPLPSIKLMALILTKRKVDIPEKQPLDMIVSSNPVSHPSMSSWEKIQNVCFSVIHRIVSLRLVNEF